MLAIGTILPIAAIAFAALETGNQPGGVIATRALSIAARPDSRTMAPGGSTTYDLRVRHGLDLRPGRRDRRRLRFKVIRGLPPGAAVDFGPRWTRNRRITLSLTAGAGSIGSHRLRLLARGGRERAVTTVELTVEPSGPSDFDISGDLDSPLEPGTSGPLDLELSNPGSRTLFITELAVSIENVEAPRATPGRPCDEDDFQIVQYSGAYGFGLTGGADSTLSELGASGSQLPRVRMTNRAVNQDGCKGATLSLEYSGSAER
jgi:hypothetical protein